MSEVVRTEFGLLDDLAVEGHATENSLYLPPETSYETWEAVGTMLGKLHSKTPWLIGDWLCFGEVTYGERYAQGAAATGLQPQTLMNYASICRRVPPERRYRGLKITIADLVASLDPAEQKAWLEVAEAGNLSRRELKDAMRGGDDDPIREKVDIEQLAKNVWHASQAVPDGFFVPEAPMRELGQWFM